MAFSVRKAVKSDMATILSLIQELADFENMSNEPTLKVEDLFRDGGFDDSNSAPLFHCFVAEEDAESNGTRVVGFALFFYAYSTWQGKTLFLEDLYVKPNYRTKGVGRLIFTAVAKYAKEMNCKRLELHVLDWNPAQFFYNKLGGTDLTSTEGWKYYRFDRQAIETLANNNE